MRQRFVIRRVTMPGMAGYVKTYFPLPTRGVSGMGDFSDPLSWGNLFTGGLWGPLSDTFGDVTNAYQIDVNGNTQALQDYLPPGTPIPQNTPGSAVSGGNWASIAVIVLAVGVGVYFISKI